jgi:Uma2 family endonuclease
VRLLPGGLPELWLVDSKADSVLVYGRSKPEAPDFDVALELGRGEALESPALRGFSVGLSALFER